jgi:hypothetical protein
MKQFNYLMSDTSINPHQSIRPSPERLRQLPTLRALSPAIDYFNRLRHELDQLRKEQLEEPLSYEREKQIDDICRQMDQIAVRIKHLARKESQERGGQRDP